MTRAPAWALAAALAAAYLLLDPPSGDLAAQAYRADLGLVLWDNGWYGGHHMPGYSVLFPPLASLFGPRVVGALAAVGAAWAFERMAHERLGTAPAARVGALWFAAGTATLLITGRLTFALGAALGLAAVLAASRDRTTGAVVLAALTSLASPVAGLFVALGAAAWWLDRRRPAALALGTAALAPGVALAIVFPEGGSFPFVASSFWPSFAAIVAVAVAVARESRLLRIGVALYALAMIASFAAPTPMGGNVVRLGALVAGPLLACLLWERDRRVLAALAVGMLYWQWAAPIDNWTRAAGDRSVRSDYYAGLIAFLDRQPGPFRVEIPFTENHWEARWVAPHHPLARGWERQLDRRHNALFYDERALTPQRYRRWLDDNAVRFVAVADAPLDYSSAAEAQLVRGGLPYLREAWRDERWRVYAVLGARPLARGAARVTAVAVDHIDLRASRAGVVDLRVRFTPYWRLTRGRGCVAPGRGAWTRLRLDAPGAVRLSARFTPGRIRASAPMCSRVK